MAGPQGALAAAFKISRALQAACLIAIIGMTANFVAYMISANTTPPQILIATLSIVCIAVLYCAITFILFLDNLLPYLIIAGIDGAFLVALIVVSVIVGRPISYLDCNDLDDMSTATSFSTVLGSGVTNSNGSKWIQGKATCLEVKSIFGLSLALCVLFFFSATCSVCCWKKAKQSTADKSAA